MKLIGFIKKSFMSMVLSLKRFPVTLLLSAFVSVLLIITSEVSSSSTETTVKMLSRIAMILALGIPVSLCIKLYSEMARNIKSVVIFISYIILGVFLILYYYFLLPDQSMVPVTRYVAFSIAFYLTAVFIPYYHKKDNYELFIIKLISSFIITLVFSGVMFFGISAIYFTLNKLLDVYIYDKLYLYTWIMIAGVFAPSYFLSNFPEYDYTFDKAVYNKFLKVLLLYIVMPILSVYTFILYIYLFKVTFTMKWPVGMVGNLVLWYSLISTFVIFLIWPLKDENKWVSRFIFWLSKLILPLIIVMFISLGIRIKAYGITESRYYVILLGLWVLGIMLYWNFKKISKNTILPLSLALIAFFCVIGPWSSYSFSINSQNNRFKSILLKYNMIKDSKIITPKNSISGNDEIEINQILLYFDTNHSLKDIKYLPKDFKFQDMKNIFGFEYNSNIYDMNSNQYFSYYVYNVNNPFDISGYDLLFSFKPTGNTITQAKDNLKIIYNNQSNEIVIYSNNKEIYKYSMKNIAERLYNQYGSSGKAEINPDDMTFTDENSNVKVKIIIYSISGNKNSPSNELRVDSADFEMLLKVK